MSVKQTAPFSPHLYEVDGAWFYEDGRMLASVQFGPLPDEMGPGEGLRILEWMCNDKGKGFSVEALMWLRKRFSFITADSVGLVDEMGMQEPALNYWIHMRRRGLVDELIDDIGRCLVVTESAVHTLPDQSDLATWSPSGPLFHVGTMARADKGVRGDSYEGHGLSVSEHPAAWEAIAKLGGQPWWSLQTSAGTAPAKFLDWHETPREHREAMLAWAAEEGLVVPCTGYRVSHHDFDHNETVFVVFEDEAAARAELEWMLEEHADSDDGGQVPSMEAFNGWKLTEQALARLSRKSADLDESPVLAALLYCESMTELDGVFWNDTLSVASLSAPRAVIFPRRLERFVVAPAQVNRASHWNDASDGEEDFDSLADTGGLEDADGSPGAARHTTRRTGAVILHTEPLDTLERAIFQAVESGSAKALKMNLDRTPPDVVQHLLPLLWKEFGGTLLHRSLERAALFAETGQGPGAIKHGGTAEFVNSNAACADILRSLGAPCESKAFKNSAGPIFLSADWGAGHSAEVMTRLMRDSVKAGDFDVNEVLPHDGSETEGLLPLQAAFKFGNAQAVQVLLDAGASLKAPLVGSTCSDIVAYARSFNATRSEEVASVVAHALMSRQLQDAGPAPAANPAPINSTETDSDTGTLKQGRGRRMGV